MSSIKEKFQKFIMLLELLMAHMKQVNDSQNEILNFYNKLNLRL